MIIRTDKWIYTLSITVLCMMAACSGSRPLIDAPAPVAENPAANVDLLEREVDKARQNRIDILVPDAFARAEDYNKRAKTALERGGEISKIMDYTSRGRLELKVAEKKLPIVTNILSEAIESRDLARHAGAEQFKKEYADAEDAFIDLTRSVENDKVARAKKKQREVSLWFRDLELRSIRKKAVGDIRESLRLAGKAGAKKIVPATFAQASSSLQVADQYITDNRYDAEEIRRKADRAKYDADRLGNVMNLSEQLNAMSAEDRGLFIENIVASIGALQNDRTFLEEKVKSQNAQIEEISEEHRSKISHLSREIGDLETQTVKERTSREQIEAKKRAVEERLEAEQQFNQLYLEVQNYFEPHEAEVYKQKYEMVIRLKDMKFPVGKSVVMPSNYELLSKVQWAIRSFGKPNVVIQGHTDSTGSEEVNELLSNQRAMAVLEYLLANGTLAVDKMQAVGYGSERPLASNATAEGRAINRRIDVVIKPLQK